MFTLSAAHLERLCAINHFPVPQDGMVLFGLRGCLPLGDGAAEFEREHAVEVAEVTYEQPRCTLGQWLPADGRIALFPGSTVPHRKYVQSARERGGVGANQLMTGYYRDYRKGRHKAGSPTGHDAFRQTQGRPVRRTADDLDFQDDDRVEFANPHDNLHAAWCMGVNDTSYASAGCQVVVGFPRCERRGDLDDAGPWRTFRANAYALDQDSFPYVLLDGRSAQAVAAGGASRVRLRFGSQGDLVTRVQEVLRERGFYEGRLDGDFGQRTLRALLAFQTQAFGPMSDDGIVGPMTAAALGIDWPRL